MTWTENTGPEAMSPAPPASSGNPATVDRAAAPRTRLQKFKDVCHQWLIIEDDSYIDVIFGAICANQLDTKPIWLYVIGPPSSGKTEVLRACEGHSLIYPLSTLTSHTLVSGKVLEPGEPDPSLLPKGPGGMRKHNHTTILFRKFRRSPRAVRRRPREEILQMNTATMRLPEHSRFCKGESLVFTLRKRAEGSGDRWWEGEPATVQDAEEGLAGVLAFAVELAGTPTPEYVLQPETLLDYDLAWALLRCADEIKILLDFVPKAVELAPGGVKERGRKVARVLLESATEYLRADLKKQRPPALEAAVLGLLKFVTGVLAETYGESRLNSLRTAQQRYQAHFTVSQ